MHVALRRPRTDFVAAVPVFLATVVALASAVRARAKENPAVDCYADWQAGIPTANVRGTFVCEDGSPDCDLDGLQDGKCTLGINLCVLQPRTGCSPTPLSSFTLAGKARKLLAVGNVRKATVVRPLQPPTDLTTAACGTSAILEVPLRTLRKGLKPSEVLQLKVIARASGVARKLTKDVDLLKVQCMPGVPVCPANPDGGPSEVSLTVPQQCTDLDNGWTGVTMNFPVVYGSTLHLCLTHCNGSSDTLCDAAGPTGAGTINGPTFGAPLPLLAAGVPVCVINNYTADITGTADLASGEINGPVNLLSDVYFTQASQVCPRCTAQALGGAGTCDTGPRAGQACRTEGIVTVADAIGNKLYTPSSQCPPFGSPSGRLTIPLPLTTGRSTLQGPKPCTQNEAQGVPVKDDACPAGGTCTEVCKGAACASTQTCGGQTVCIDRKGGISQLCCSTDTTVPCQPTGSGAGAIVRKGVAAVPQPAPPSTAYPKTASGVLVATFCEPPTDSNVINSTTGLPGPGALILPADETWTK